MAVPTLPNPWVILGALATLIAVWFYRGESVSAARDNYWEKIVVQAEAQARQAKIDADLRVSEASRKAQADIDAVGSKLRKALGELDDAHSAVDSLRAAVAAGNRVRIAVKRDAVCPAQPANTAGTASGRESVVYAELPRETVEALDDFARDADRAALKHNACVAAYEQVKTRLDELSHDDHRVSDVRGGGSATP